MANNHESFIEFNNSIRLSDARRRSLKASRKELRNKIRRYFKDEKPDELFPKFSGQGSLLMDIIINPIPRKKIVNGEEKQVLYYDVDDGVYFISESYEDNRKTIAIYHQWIYNAVKSHTDKDPISKNTCIRVIFADGHNIDLPIYYKQNTIPELAHKKDGWITSDPKAFVEWFNNLADKDSQLRRIVRYMKAWKDFREFNDGGKSFPSGFILAILAATHPYQHERDDIAFKETLILIQATLNSDFKCFRPTTPIGENLLQNYSQKEYFMQCLKDMITSAKKAIEESNGKNSCEILQKQFGERFSCSNIKNSNQDEGSKELKIMVGGHKPYCEY